MRLAVAIISLLSSLTAYAQPPQAVADLIARTYKPEITSTEQVVSHFFNLCEQKSVELTAQDPVTLQPGKVTLKTYALKTTTDTDLKTVIVLPPTGGENALDRGYADTLCLAGFRVALVEHWDSDTVNELDMDMHDRGTLRMISAVRHVIEYLKPQRPGQLGILGTSVGAISSALIVGLEPRVSAGMLIVGGGGMVEIISSSDEQHLTALRAERMKAFNLSTQDDYKNALAQHIHIDPLDFVGLSGPKKVLMMVATKDTTVPTKNQFELYHAFGDQELLTHDSDHLGTILYTFATQQFKIVEFFKTNLQ